MHTVKYRLFDPRLQPRRTKLEMPGWAGHPEPRKDGSHEYAWHCMPFTEGAQYGIEIFYPYDNELRVTQARRRGRARRRFRPVAGSRRAMAAVPQLRRGVLYLSAAARSARSATDMAVRTEPHPRFYTEPTDDVPLAVPALLRTELVADDLVCRVQGAGRRAHAHLPARRAVHADPLPAGEADFELVPMDEEEAAEREMRGRRIHASRATLAAKRHVDVVHRYRVRRHLSPPPSRGQGQGPGKTAPEASIGPVLRPLKTATTRAQCPGSFSSSHFSASERLPRRSERR